jgi:hypothetical protein
MRSGDLVIGGSGNQKSTTETRRHGEDLVIGNPVIETRR